MKEMSQTRRALLRICKNYVQSVLTEFYPELFLQQIFPLSQWNSFFTSLLTGIRY